MLFDRLLTCHLARKLDGRHHGNHMVAKIWKAQRNEADDHGTGGIDHGIADVLLVHIAAGVFRDDLRGAGHLKHVVKADV